MSDIHPHKWRAFIGICLLSFGCYLDFTVVNVALPTIQEKLHTSLTSLQWIMNIYFLVLCILATVMGQIGDLYGRRRLFYIGAGIFAVSSLLAGIAPDIHWLIFGRLLQGVSAAIVLPLGPSLLPAVFPENERNKVIGWLGSLGGVALALGPLLGGIIVAYWGWRWIFFINIPLTVLGFLFCLNAVKESKSLAQQHSLDWQGMIGMAFTMGGIVLGLIHSATSGWTDPLTLIFLAIGIVAGIILVKIERRKENPLIDFKDFSRLLFYSGAILGLLCGILMAVALFFDPLYLQVIRQLSPQLSGLILFAIPVAVLAVALMVGWLIRSFGIINTILMGLAIGTVSGLLQAFFTVTTPMWFVLISFIALGGMWAMGNTVAIIAAQASVVPERVSVATGTIVTTFNMGGSIGLALGVMIFHFVSLYQISHHAIQTDNLRELLTNPAHAMQISMDKLLRFQFNAGFMHGFSATMWFLFAVCSAGLLSILIWKLCERKKKYVSQ